MHSNIANANPTKYIKKEIYHSLKEKKKKRLRSKFHLNPLKIVPRPLVYLTQGIASYYGIGDGFQGARTASGVRFNTYSPMCAMRYVKLGTWVHVKNLTNNRVALCEILDKGPYVANRVIDLSYYVKKAIGMNGGTTLVGIW